MCLYALSIVSIFASSEVVFPEKYFLGKFLEIFRKFSEEKENIPQYLIYQKKSYEPQYQYVCSLVTGQLADKPTRGQTTRGLDNSRTGQLADWTTRGHLITC